MEHIARSGAEQWARLAGARILKAPTTLPVASRYTIANGPICIASGIVFVVWPIALAGIFPHVFMTFAILDPALALGAWLILSRNE
jgi:hypothetical protein